MIEITCMSDIEKLNNPNIHCTYKNYIEDYLKEMLLRFDCGNLANLGSIFVLEDENELKSFSPSSASHVMNVGLIANKETLNITQLFFFEKSFARVVFINDVILKKYLKNKSIKVG